MKPLVSPKHGINLLSFAEFTLRVIQSKDHADPRENILKAGEILGIFKFDEESGKYVIMADSE